MKLLKNFFALIFESSFKMLLGFFLNIYMARTLGPSQMGNISYVLSFSMIFLPLFSFGTDDWFFARIAQEKDSNKINEYLGASLLVRLIGPLIGIILCYISIYLFSNNQSLAYLILIYSLFMSFKVFDVINIFLMAKEDIRLLSLLRNLGYIILTSLKILSLYLHQDFKEIIYLSCLDFVLIAFIYIFVFKYRGMKFLYFKFDFSTIKSALKVSWPLTILAFINVAIIRIDQIMLGNLLDSYSLGQYAIVVKIVEIFQFIPVTIMTVFLPKVLSSKERYTELKSSVISLILFIGLSFSISMTMISPYVIPILFGNEYLVSGNIFQYYVWQSLFFFLFLARQKFFIAEERIYPILIYGVIALISNVGLNYIWIIELGVFGAVYASIVSFIVTELILATLSPQFRKNSLQIFKSFNFIKTYYRLKPYILNKYE